jgi:uncharacterized protein YjgD (DUF1641 family)
MNEHEIQQRFDEINTKLDLLISNVNEQQRRDRTIEDLLADLSIIGREAYRNAVDTLDRKGVELDTAALTTLLLRLIRNVHTFNRLMDMFESAIDFMNDAGPIARESIIDFMHWMNEIDRRGYFDLLRELPPALDAIAGVFKPEDIRALPGHVLAIKRISDSLANADVMSGLESISGAIATVHPDEQLDDKSLLQIARELRSPEIRRTLSYMLRVIKAAGQAGKNE